jgi:hypothetical protein
MLIKETNENYYKTGPKEEKEWWDFINKGLEPKKTSG